METYNLLSMATLPEPATRQELVLQYRHYKSMHSFPTSFTEKVLTRNKQHGSSVMGMNSLLDDQVDLHTGLEPGLAWMVGNWGLVLRAGSVVLLAGPLEP